MTLGTDAPPLAHKDDSTNAPRKKSVPRWLPISLLAFSSVALIAPVVLLRRHRANLLSRSLEEAPPPRRTTTVSAALGTAKATGPRQLTLPHLQTSALRTQETSHVEMPHVTDDFNGALYSLKAFGYATLIVMAGGLTTVWGVKTYMGVDNTEEFAFRMRSLVQAKMPGLMARLHRAPSEEDGLPPSITPADSQVIVEDLPETTEWNWPDAEKRLRTAFDREGFSGWADAMIRELELESKVERQKRGQA